MGIIYKVGKAFVPPSLKRSLMGRMRSFVLRDFESVVSAWRNDGARPASFRHAAEQLLNEIKIDRTVREAATQFESLRGRKNLKLHLGAGGDIRHGWVNIDLALRFPPEVDRNAPPGTMFINYDLRRGLPLDDASCDLIYSSHFWEHLEYREGLDLMRECHRVLRPGGVFRISLPHFKNVFGAYLRQDHEYFSLVNILEALPDVEPGTEMLVDHVNYGVYQHGEHKCIYDEEKVVLLLRRLGYASVAVAEYKEGVDPADMLRRKYSFYVEATK
jgi:SAM-dependent methyltransferase